MNRLSARDAYRILAAEYDRTPNALISLESRTMLGMLPDVDGCRVVDVAAGTGRWARVCGERGARTIAVDFCFEMVVQSPRPAVLADSCLLPFADECSDVTICAFALGYSPECFAELARITGTGGIVIVSDVHPEALQRGWTRSFRHDGDVVNVEHSAYSISDLRAKGLELTALEEPRFDWQEEAIYARAGRRDLFQDAKLVPAIFVARWMKA